MYIDLTEASLKKMARRLTDFVQKGEAENRKFKLGHAYDILAEVLAERDINDLKAVLGLEAEESGAQPEIRPASGPLSPPPYKDEVFRGLLSDWRCGDEGSEDLSPEEAAKRGIIVTRSPLDGSLWLHFLDAAGGEVSGLAVELDRGRMKIVAYTEAFGDANAIAYYQDEVLRVYPGRFGPDEDSYFVVDRGHLPD